MVTFVLKVREGKLTAGQKQEVFDDYLKLHEGHLMKIEPVVPESKDQRGYYHGGVIPFILFHEGKNWRSVSERQKCHHLLKTEFNGELYQLNGIVHKIPKSTKNKLNTGFLERVIGWMQDNGYEVPDPTDYKKWRDELGQPGGDYLVYCLSVGKLKLPA